MTGRFFKSSTKSHVVETDHGAGPLLLVNSSRTQATSEDNAETEGRSTLPDFVSERVNLHRFLLDKINLALLDTMEEDELHDELRPLVRDYSKNNNFPLNAQELDKLVSDLADEMLGLGPLETLLEDDSISDILVVGADKVYLERFGRIEETNVRFKDEEHLMRIVNKIVASVGRRVDESSPMVDARLADGSRVNIAVRPVAVDGPLVSIRKFSRRPFNLKMLVENGAVAGPMARVLSAAVEGRISIVISGGTGSGKTTLLNALSSSIPHEERLVTIEDAAELQLQQPHVARLETRPPTVDGRNEILQRDLVKNALRMRPDRIIVGEVRGPEAFDMLQAMNTGHEGSMTTIHANSPRDALARMEQMVGMAGMPMSQISIRAQIASAIDVVVQLERMRDGTRRVVAISEITGMEGDVIQMQDIMLFKRMGQDEDGKIRGRFHATGLRPRFLEEINSLGIMLDEKLFDPTKEM